MFKKSLATAALAVIAVFAFAPAANAVDYVSDSLVSIAAGSTAGETTAVAFAADAFEANESVTYSVTGAQTAVLSIIKTNVASITKTAAADGSSSVNVALPANATGDYTVTASAASATYTATLDLIVADAAPLADTADDGLAATGFNAPVLVIWGAAGILVLGVALVLVRRSVRRQHTAA